MKKIKFNMLALSACAFLILWTGCVSEMGDKDKGNAHPTQPETLTTFATQTTVPTRTTLNHTIGNGADVFWEAGDNIWIDNSGTFVSSISSNIIGKMAHAQFKIPGTLTASSYDVYYTGKASTMGNRVTIKANQTQTAPNDFAHLGVSGDCGVASAAINPMNTNQYLFQLEHKAAYLCLMPFTSNPLARNFKLKSVTIKADNDIAGDYALTTAGLSAAPTANGTKEIKLTVNDFTLPASYAIDNACYIVMAPQTTALNIVYELYNPATNTTGTVTTNVPSQTYDANGFYDFASDLVKDYSQETTLYMWDAKRPYYYGKTPPYTAADAPQSKAADPDRWFNDNFTAGHAEVAQYSCRDCPTQIEAAWYLTFYAYKDDNEFWTANGKVYKGVRRFKKWAYLVADHGASKTAIPTSIPADATGTPWDRVAQEPSRYPGYDPSINCTIKNPPQEGSPSPNEMKKYFTLPGDDEFGTASYWTSTSCPVNDDYLAGNELIGPYIWFFPAGTIMCNWNYIGRARYEARRAVKFQ
ncbi:MAG: hypothetical protein ACTTJ9_06100 [Segatella oris]|uniref:hypothetical protein n=1 Tax=Prevotellaceae TaxID=171552 RepID=UPI003FA02BFA